MATVTQEYILQVTAKGLRAVVREIKALRGDMSQMTAAGNEVAGGLDKASGAADRYSKKNKGVGKLTNNNTKAFSKMQTGMTSGLVPAYATVAANVFALTAAFGALSRAADFEVLIRGAEELEAQTGRSLVNLAKGMKAVTDGAISMKEALISASIAASAGFDNSTIIQLTEVARNASIALGRDMTDALNRVFKGAIKAEPELLDELGIILRLDPATRAYAASVGKAVTELTTFEKQQAVVNAVIEQGQTKFELLSDVDVNPLAQLSASFSNLVATALAFVNIPLSPIFSFFADNMTALSGAMLVFGSTVLKTAIPALAKFGAEAQKTINESIARNAIRAAGTQALKEFAAAAKESTEAVEIVRQKQVQLVEDLAEGSKAALGKSLFAQIEADAVGGKTRLESMHKVVKTTDQALINLQKRQDIGSDSWLRQRDAIVDVNKSARVAIETITGVNAGLLSQNKYLAMGQLAWANFSTRMGQVKSAGIEGFFKGQEGGLLKLIPNYKIFRDTLNQTAKATDAIGFATKTASKGIFLLTGAFGGLLKAIPLIGQLLVAFTLLKNVVTWVLDLFRDVDALEAFNDAIENSESSADVANKAFNRYNKTLKNLPDTVDNITTKTTLLKNSIGGLTSALEELIEAAPEEFGILDAIVDVTWFGQLDNFKDALEGQAEALQKIDDPKINKFLEELGEIEELTGKEALVAAKRLSVLEKELNKTAQTAFEANEAIKKTFEALGKAIDDTTAKLPKLTASQSTLIALNDILLRTADGAVSLDQLASSFANLSDAQASTLGISGLVEGLSALASNTQTATKEIQKLKKELEEEKGFGILTSNDATEEALQAKIEQLEGNVLANRRTSSLLVSDINIKVQEQVDILAKVEAATLNIAKIRARAAFDLSAPNLLLQDRLQLLSSLADAEKDFYDTLSSQSSQRITDLENESKALETALAKSRRVTSTPEDVPTPPEAAKNVLGADEILAKEARISTIAGERIRHENNILKNQQAASKVYLSLLKAQRKSLFENAEAIRLGIPGFQALTKTLKEGFVKTLEDSYTALGIQNETMQEFVNKNLEAVKSAEAIKSLFASMNFKGIDAGIGNVDALADQHAALARTNELLKETNFTLDTRLDKAEMIRSREIEDQQKRAQYTVDTLSKEAELSKSQQDKLDKANEALGILRTDKALTDALGRSKIMLYSDKFIANLTRANKFKLEDLKVTKATTLAEHKLEAQRLLARELGLKGIDKLSDKMKDLSDAAVELKFAEDFKKEVEGMVDALTPLSGILDEMQKAFANPEIDNFTASMVTLSKIGKQTGNNISEGFGNFGTILAQMQPKIKEAGGSISDLDASDKFKLMEGAFGGMATAMGEGTKAAKILTGVTTVLATVSAALAIVDQAKGGGYEAFAKMAAMAAVVGSILSAAGIAFGSSGEGSSGADKAKDDYTTSVGSHGIVGGTMQSNALIDSIDQLIAVDSELFSATEKLQVAVRNLDKSFKVVGGASFSQAGDFGDINLLEVFGFKEFTDFDPGFFGDETTSAALIGSGLKLGASIEFVGDTIAGTLEDVNLFLLQMITETDSGFLGFGGGTDTTLFLATRKAGDRLTTALDEAFSSTLNVLIGLFNTLGGGNTDLSALFSGVDDIDIDTTKLELVGKTAEEQGEIIAAFFSNLSNEVVGSVLPWVTNFTQAGEELTDTLLRLTTQSVILQNALDTVDFNFRDLVGDIDSSVAEGISLLIVTAWQDALIGNFPNPEAFNSVFEQFSQTLWSESELAQIALTNAQETLGRGIGELTAQVTDIGFSTLATTLSADINAIDFRAFVDSAKAVGAFEGVEGADLFATVIKVGAAIGIIEDSLSDLDDALSSFDNDILRQIQLFGLLGKELDNLQLDFELADTLKDARESGGNIEQVEQLFGLRRLAIVKEFNQEIVDLLKDGFDSVADSMLTVVKGFSNWNEVVFQGLKVDKMFNNLVDSLKATSIDFSAFTDNVVDMQDAINFEELFGSLVSFSDIVPDKEDIAGQIQLVEDLKDAVIDRYNIEKAAMEDIKTLSIDIQGFLRDLNFSDISPLTNAEQLDLAISRFDKNFTDVFSTDTAVSEKARGDLLDSADLLLNLSSEFFSIGPQFQAIFDTVIGKLEAVDEDILEKLGLSDEALATEEQTNILSDLQQQTIDQLSVLETVLTELDTQNTESLNYEIENLGIEVTTHLDFITDKLQALNDTTWIPILNALTNMNSFATGTPEVQFNQIAQIHQGEMIVPAAQAEFIRDSEAVTVTSTTNTKGEEIRTATTNSNNIITTPTLRRIV